MSESVSRDSDASVSHRVRAAVAELNQAISDAARTGIEVEVSVLEHQSVGNPAKLQIVSARLLRPIRET